jgi:hypothetical protein
MRNLLVLAVVGVVFAGGVALAGGAAPTAAYDGDGFSGVLTIEASAGSAFTVRSQGPDGNYDLATRGVIGSNGRAALPLAERGPGDSVPQFVVSVDAPDGRAVLSVPGIRDWHWD